MDAADRVAALGQSVDAEHLFLASQILVSLLLPAEEAMRYGGAGLNRLLFELVPFFGRPDHRLAEPGDVRHALDAMVELQQRNGRIFSQAILESESPDYELVRATLRTMQANYVMLPSASLLERQITEIQGEKDIAGTKRQLMIDPKEAVCITLALQRLQERRRAVLLLDSWQAANAGSLLGRSIAPMAWPVIENAITQSRQKKGEPLDGPRFSAFLTALLALIPRKLAVTRDDFPPAERPALATWTVLCDILGYTPAQRATQTDPLAVQDRPLLLLRDGRVWLAHDLPVALHCLWTAFDNAYRRESERSYHNTYANRKAGWTERTVARVLTKLLPGASVTRNQKYRDGPFEGDIDVLVQWPPFLLIVQVKARKMLPEIFRGESTKELKQALDQNFWEAETQADKDEKYLRSKPEVTFTDAQTRRELKVRHADYPYIFRLVVPLHDTGGIMGRTQLADAVPHSPKGRTIKRSWLISLWMLEELVDRVPNPHTFLHFLSRRLAMIEADCAHQASEDTFFNIYLHTQLADEIWQGSADDFMRAYSRSPQQGLQHRIYRDVVGVQPPPAQPHLPQYYGQLYKALTQAPDTIHNRHGCHKVLNWTTADREEYAGLVTECFRKGPVRSHTNTAVARTTIIAGSTVLLAVVPTIQASTLPHHLAFHAQQLLGTAGNQPAGAGQGILLVGYVDVDDPRRKPAQPIAEYWHPQFPSAQELLGWLSFLTNNPVNRAKRNDLCPCKSGNKVKDCCGLKREEALSWLRQHTQCRA